MGQNLEILQDYLSFLLKESYPLCLFTLGCSLAGNFVQRQISLHQKDYQYIKNMKTHSIQELLQDIYQQNPSVIKYSRPYGEDSIIIDCLLTGQVKPHPSCQSLESSIYRHREFVSKAKFIENVYVHPRPREEIAEDLFQNVPYFILKDFNSEKQILIHNHKQVDKKLALQTIQKIYPQEKSYHQIVTMALGYLGLRGWTVGIAESEVGIMVDSPLLVFGQCVFNFKEKTLEATGPKFYLQEKGQILGQLKETLREQRSYRSFFYGLALASVGLMLWRLWKFYQKRQKKVFK